MRLYLLFYCLSTFIAFSQSTHMDELYAHPTDVSDWQPSPAINYVTTKSNCTLNKTVFGWHPYWMNGAEQNYQWDLLSDLCFFGYEVDPATGNATSTHGFATNDAVDSALANNTDVHLCVILFSNHATFFSNASAQTTLINNLISLIQARGAHGINIDFEGVPSSQSANLTAFMINLSTALHAANPNYQLSMCLYAVDWSNLFDEPALSNVVDFFTIMGYDYYYSGSAQAGPADPLYGFTNSYDYSLSRSVSYYINAGIPASKLVLGLPYYGREWETTSNAIPASTTGANVFSRTYDVVRTNTSGNYINPTYNSRSSSKGYIFQNAGTWRQCWISESNELKERYDLVNRRGLKGIGIWALGYDDGYTDLWQAIDEKLTSCNSWNCSDTLYDEGGPEVNYYNNELVQYTINPPGAVAIDVNFLEFATEANYDTLWLYDGNTTTSPLIGAFHGTNSPGAFTTTSGALTLRFKSDGGTRASGWKMSYQCIQDNTPPSIQVNIPNTWQTQNTVASIQANDASGVWKTYWNAHALVNNAWQGNENTGHAYESMNVPTNWNPITGNWSYTGGSVVQTDEANGNTNFALPMPLTSSDDYLFEWKGAISGTGTNRRAGMHFMCSDLNLPNRGNSYFVWFRVDSDVIQLYEVTNDVFSVVASFPFTIDPGQPYHCQTTYNLSSGKIRLYVDGVYVGEWTDTTPLALSTGISMRSGNAQFLVDHVSVYTGTFPNNQLLVGPNGHFFTCNPSVPEKSGRILVHSIDVYNNWSADSSYYNVDFTPPVLQIPTEEVIDKDTLLNTNLLQLSNLIAVDTNSGISQLLASVEDLLNGTEVLSPFVVTTTNEQQNLSGLVNLMDYRIRLVATNGANLSDTTVSDGFKYISDLSVTESNHDELNVYPNPFKEEFVIIGQQGSYFVLKDLNSKTVVSGNISESFYVVKCKELSSGIYYLQIGNEVKKISKI